MSRSYEETQYVEGAPLALAVLEAALTLGVAVAAVIVAAYADTVTDIVRVGLLALVSLFMAAVSVMYAITRSPDPLPLRITRYACLGGGAVEVGLVFGGPSWCAAGLLLAAALAWCAARQTNRPVLLWLFASGCAVCAVLVFIAL